MPKTKRLYRVTDRKTGDVILYAADYRKCLATTKMAQKTFYRALNGLTVRGGYKVEVVGKAPVGAYGLHKMKPPKKRANLEHDMKAAAAAGMTYGRYKALEKLKEGE